MSSFGTATTSVSASVPVSRSQSEPKSLTRSPVTKPDSSSPTDGSIPMAHAADAPVRAPFTVFAYGSETPTKDEQGVTLKPTMAYNILLWFMSERWGIERRRRAWPGSGPWTLDPHLQTTYACNTFRVLDKACQYFIREVIDDQRRPQFTGPSDIDGARETLFRVILFHAFTLPATWELLEKHLGEKCRGLTWKNYVRAKYQKVLEGAGRTLFSCAFQKQNGGPGGSAVTYALDLIESIMEGDEVLNRILDVRPSASNPGYVADLYAYLLTFRGVGEFNAYQLILNLSYTPLLVMGGDDFVMSGPGTRSGLGKMFQIHGSGGFKEADGSELCDDVIRWIYTNQEREFALLRLPLPFLSFDAQTKLKLELADFEHAICEVDKFLRITHPSMKGGNGRKSGHNLRKFGGAGDRGWQREAVLPRVWDERVSMEKKDFGALTRVKPRVSEDEPVWVVQRIEGREVSYKEVSGSKKRKRACSSSRKKTVLYHVRWAGEWSADEHMTWEPEEHLLEDVPKMVKEWIRDHGRV